MKILTCTILAVGLVSSLAAARTSPKPFTSVHVPEFRFRAFEDDAGGFYLVWIDGETDKTFTLRAQHIGPAEQSLWESPGLPVASHVSSFEDWHGLADGQGGLTLFWDEQDGVHAQRYRPDGSRKRSENSILMSTSTAIQPAAVPDALGGTLVVWRQKLSGGRSVVMAQRLDEQGNPVWPSGGLRVSLRASSQTNPHVVYDNMSGMVVAWRDEANSASELRVQRIDFTGNRLWGLEGLTITAPLGTSEFPEIAAVGTGEVAIAWTAPVAQTSQILLQKAGPGPTLQWGAGVYASAQPSTSNRWNPVLRGDEAGGAWIAWEDFSNQVNYQIHLNHLDASGVSLWPSGPPNNGRASPTTGGDFAIAPAAGDQGKMAMAGDGKDSVWLAWIDNRLANIGLYVQEVDGSGRLLQGNAGHLVADQLTKPSRPQLVSLGQGKAVVAWANRPQKGQWTLSWSAVGPP